MPFDRLKRRDLVAAADASPLAARAQRPEHPGLIGAPLPLAESDSEMSRRALAPEQGPQKLGMGRREKSPHERRRGQKCDRAINSTIDPDRSCSRERPPELNG